MDQRLLNDVLECSVCLEQLDDTSRVLPCQHTFCLRCLHDIVQSHKELRCPECRVLVTVSLENLPPNILLMRILEGLRNTTRCSLGPLGAVSNTPHKSSLQSSIIPSGRDIFDGPPLTQAPPLPPITSQIVSSASDSGSGLESYLEVSSSANRDTSSSKPFINIVESIFMGGGSGSILSGGSGSILSGLEGEMPGLSEQSYSNSISLGELTVKITKPIISPSTTITTVGSSHGVSSLSSNNHLSIAASTYHRQQSTSGQQPCAKALYKYDRKEPRDLSFKKGDTIILRKKIDSNWYQGELNGHIGFFPASYVQVIIPLPSHIPQCKGLYDFKMTNDDERDCLTFNKGDVITILRRVDENWAEGKLGTRIGIFPLSFVDLNSAAKVLMKLTLNASAGPSRIAPPTPTNLEDPPSLFILADIGPPPTQAPPLPTHTDITSSSSSSVVTSPDQSLTSTSSPSSPPRHTSQSPPTPPVATTTPLLRGHNSQQQREKRHSFTAVRSYHPSSPSRSPTTSPHRHSLEIVSSEEDKSSFIAPLGLGAGGLGTSLANRDHDGSGVDSSKLHVKDSSANFSILSTDVISSSAPQVNVTTFFVAIYTYRGRKSDELDLRKGYLYTVNEKCQDGWYKGRCIATDKIGVFPGNYVQVAKPQMIAAYLAKRNSRHSSHHNRNNISNGAKNRSSITISNTSSHPSSVVSYTRPRQNPSKSNDVKIDDAITSNSSPPSSLPPELPPRSVSATVDIISSEVHTVPSTESALPLWHYSQGYSSIHRNVSGHCSAVSPPPNVALAEGTHIVTTVPQSTKSERRWSKERGSCSGGSGGMSLMRKLTSSSKKKCKSPTPITYSMDNPVFEDSTISPTPGNLHTTHTRSGSNPDNSEVGTSTSTSTSVQADVDLNNTMDMSRRSKQPAPLMRERFRCIVPYPPNSDYELELQQGDIIYVHKKRDDGWYKGTLQRTGKTGLFPASFVESC